MFIVSAVFLSAVTLVAVHIKVLYFVMYRPYSAYLYLSSIFYKKAFLETGQFPLWDTSMMCGISDTSNVPFPLSLFRVFMLLGCSSIFSLFLVELFFMLMGTVFFYLLMRLYRCSRLVSLFGTFLYMIWLYKWNVSEGYPMALAPVIFYICQKYEDTSKYKYIFFGVLAVAVTSLTGIIHAIAVIFLFHMVVMGCFFWQGISRKYCLAGMLSWGLGFVLALPSLLPQAQDVLISQRLFYAKAMFDFVHLDWTKFWLRLNEVLQLFPFTPLFLFCFVLAFISVFFLTDKKLKTIFFASAGFFVFHVVLSFTQTAWRAVPVIGKLINAFDLYRSAALIGFVVLFFATYAVQAFINAPLTASRKRKISIAALTVLITGFFVFLYQVAASRALIIMVEGFGVLAFVAVHLFSRSKVFKGMLNVLLAGTLIYYGVLYEADFFYNYCYKNIREKGFPFVQTVWKDTYPLIYLGLFADEPTPSKNIVLKIMKEDSAKGHFRSADLDTRYNFYGKVRFYAEGVSSVYGVANIYPSRYYDFFGWMTNTPTGYTTDAAYAFGLGWVHNQTLLSLAGVKWFIAPSDFETDHFRLVWNGVKYALYRNENVFPRAFVVFQLKGFNDKEEMEVYLKKAELQELRTSAAILQEDLNGFPLESMKGTGEGAAEITVYEPNQVVIETEVSKDGMLILTDMFHPNWRATVDGVPVEIYPAYYTFRMVAVPKGKHTVRFFIQDNAFMLALWISFWTFLGMILYFFWEKARKKRRGLSQDRP